MNQKQHSMSEEKTAAPLKKDGKKEEAASQAPSIEAAEDSAIAQAAQMREYTIVAGDSLWKIAGSQLGEGSRWPELFELNKGVLGSNPHLIYPGTRIGIPIQENSSEVEKARNPQPAPEQYGVCGPPPFQHAMFQIGATFDERALATARLRIKAAVTKWGQSFSDEWVSIHTLSPDQASIVVQWQTQWGEPPTVADYEGLTHPLEARLAVVAAKGSDGWEALGASVRSQVEALLGGESNALSAVARDEFLQLYGDSGWVSQDAAAQANLLEGLLTARGARPYLVGAEAEPQPAEYTLSGPKVTSGHAFRGVEADAHKWEVEVDGQRVPIYAPAAPDAEHGHFHSVEQAAIAYASLPQAGRAVVNSITLNAVQNPDDAYWAAEYNTPDFRSYMTAGAAGDITIYPTSGRPPRQADMSATLVHEAGHTWSYRTWGQDSSGAAWQPWRDAMDKDRAAVSNYATNSVDEDVAETVSLYCNVKGTPKHDEYRKIVPNRFKILDGHF